MGHKIAVITCYKKQDYVRANTLAKAISDNHNYKLLPVRNRVRGIGRYAEVVVRLIMMRVRHHPDVYILTFRGYEMLLPSRLITIGKPLVFDEFINAEEWLLENNKFKPGSLMQRLFHHFYRTCLLMVRAILADTHSHAKYAAKLSNIPLNKYAVVPVGVDEHMFKPQTATNNDQFEVFYYSTENQPLHGMRYVCEAAQQLNVRYPKIHFTLIGGGDMERLVQDAVMNGANITHHAHVPYNQIAEQVSQADVCLGGPFGNTLQSKFVVTGKTYQFMAAARATIVGKNKETSRPPFVNKENCLLVEQGSSRAIADALAWTYENPKYLQKIGQQARATYEQYFSNRQLQKVVTSVIDDL